MTKMFRPGTNWLNSTLTEYDREASRQDTRPLTETADPLALSWASYHVWQKSPNRRWVSWADVEAAPHDLEIAQSTRRYYRDKIAMQTLRGGTTSDFRRDLYDICNGGIMRHKHIGLLYRLPYFYVEDITRQDLMSFTQAHPSLDQPPEYITSKHTLALRPYRKIFHSRRHREIMEYWFHDCDRQYAVQLPVMYDNPLRSMIDHVFDSTDLVRLHAHTHLGHDRRHNFLYWTLRQPELRFE